MLLLVALLEVALNRIAVPMLRPTGAPPPSWHTYLDYAGLFVFYFAGTLAVLLMASRCWQAVGARITGRGLVATLLVGVTTVLAAAPLVVDVPAALSFALECAFAASVIAIAVASLDKRADLGAQIGIAILALPLLLHTVSVICAKLVWPDDTFEGPGLKLLRGAVIALCLAAWLTPYCFAPRPFARAVSRPLPSVIALTTAAAGVLLASTAYPALATAVKLAIGVELMTIQPDRWLAAYLIAIATLAWTLTSTALAPSAARRQIGLGIALVVLGGYAFKWPHHYLLPLAGLWTIAGALRTVREEELAALPITSETPPVGDPAWAAYIALVAQGLRRALGDVHSLTTRGEGGLATSTIVGEARGIPVRARIERIDGCVLALDVVLGREIDEGRGATLAIWAIPPRALGVNPAGPPAAPLFKTGDAQFDERFKTRGSALAFRALFDDGLRARTIATIDGWLAYWEHESLRFRVYPGRGAPLDHPMPLSDLALGRASATPERLVAVIELLVDLASRGVAATPASEPTLL